MGRCDVSLPRAVWSARVLAYGGVRRAGAVHSREGFMFKRFACVLALAFACFFAPTEASAELVFQSNPTLQNDSKWGTIELLLQMLADALNSEVVDYPSVPLGLVECGQANAFYMPRAANGPGILVCTELVDYIFEHVRKNYEDAYLGAAATSMLGFIVVHELGHALVDLLDLPITGREEDVVDQLAAVILEAEPEMVIMAATFWRGQFQERRGLEDYAGVHGLSEQRFFNMLCWAYGADPVVRHYIAKSIPDNRRARCEGETTTMTRAWKQMLGERLNPRFGSLPNRRVPSGTWYFSEHLASEDGTDRCVASGTITMLGYISGTMNQTGVCITPRNGPLENNQSAKVRRTDTSEEGFSFTAGEGCTYTARYDDASRLSIRGEVRCGTMVGSFSATR